MIGISPHPLGFRILGIDPGLNTTGYGVLEVGAHGPIVREAGVIRSTESGRDATEMAPRLAALYDGLMEVFTEFAPQAVALEQLYAHYEHPRTAILMAHARGVLVLVGGQRQVPVSSYSATRIKKTITGNGRASKEQMQHAIRHELQLVSLPEPHDVADALGVALCHYYSPAIPRPTLARVPIREEV
jgi:crossover junction endodeoxyribonuclease RuvC